MDGREMGMHKQKLALKPNIFIIGDDLRGLPFSVIHFTARCYA